MNAGKEAPDAAETGRLIVLEQFIPPNEILQVLRNTGDEDERKQADPGQQAEPSVESSERLSRKEFRSGVWA